MIPGLGKKYDIDIETIARPKDELETIGIDAPYQI